MKMPNRHPWLFVLLTVLILLAGGMAVGMATVKSISFREAPKVCATQRWTGLVCLMPA